MLVRKSPVKESLTDDDQLLLEHSKEELKVERYIKALIEEENEPATGKERVCIAPPTLHRGYGRA
jgi:hypothetical protein